MEVKKDMLWRTSLCYILVVLACIAVMVKAFYIQQIQGSSLRNLSDSIHRKIVELTPERGTIYSEDGEMLSTSIPQFDVYIDFGADGLREKSGKRFRQNLDSLSLGLAAIFPTYSAGTYKKMLQQGYKSKNRYFPLLNKISFREYQSLKQLPLVRLGKNKSGFIIEEKTIRLNPYKNLAFRTIGLYRENAQKVGLEQTYDSVLKGTNGKRLVRYIAGGASVPVNDYQIASENGKDIVTTIDVFIQEVTENALMKMMVQNEAEHGCAIVMETKTGKIKAIANLGRGADGNYYENFNYALAPSEPGSTFKLATLMALLEDGKINLNGLVNLNGGTWEINGSKVIDSESHGRGNVTIQQAFELSSNVGMAKIALGGYARNPKKFIQHLTNMRFDTLTGIDLAGERKATIPKPGGKFWSSISLPWMAFGYNIAITPMQTLSFYNAVANKGVMMKPYLVKAIQEEGKIIKEFEPEILVSKLCSNQTIAQLNKCLEGVCTNGTAAALFKNSPYKVAGKTGTALVADGSKGYENKTYQSSFAGFFPANDPQYTCIVVIKNNPQAKVIYGAAVAGPVFKEIADRLFATKIKSVQYLQLANKKTDSSFFNYVLHKEDAEIIGNSLAIPVKPTDIVDGDWVNVNRNAGSIHVYGKSFSNKTVPSFKGMSLKDAVYVSENLGLKVAIKGKGKVVNQFPEAGTPLAQGSKINFELN